MLKAVLKDKDTTGRFLLNFGDTIVEWYRTAKARQTFLHKRTWQKNLRDFVHSLDKDDIAFEDIDENFGEEYKLFLKRDQGRIDSYVNHCLLWLNMLMYKAVDRSIIRFNPIAKIGYEKKAAPKMTHISKADFIKMLSTPIADERTELARRCFIFASLTSLSYIDVKKLYPHHISENSDGRKFIRKEREKTGVEFFVPLHPIAEKILSLYNTTDDSKPVFPLGEKKDIYLDVHTLGMVLGISNKLGFHASRHTFGVLMLNEDIPIGSIAKMMEHADITSTQVYAQVTEQKISNDMDKLIAKRERNRLSNEKTIPAGFFGSVAAWQKLLVRHEVLTAKHGAVVHHGTFKIVNHSVEVVHDVVHPLAVSCHYFIAHSCLVLLLILTLLGLLAALD